MKVILNKETILCLYCCCREAERSVHRALDAKWEDFQNYYSGAKTTCIIEVIKGLFKLVSPGHITPFLPNREEACATVSEPGIIRYYLGKWIARRKRSWSFPTPQIHFLALTLNTLMTLLTTRCKPTSTQLISLRMDLCACEYIIECRCHGLGEIERARRMDHFHRTEWLPYVTLADILGKDLGEIPRTKRSA
jgi:hypothetical protein